MSEQATPVSGRAAHVETQVKAYLKTVVCIDDQIVYPGSENQPTAVRPIVRTPADPEESMLEDVEVNNQQIPSKEATERGSSLSDQPDVSHDIYPGNSPIDFLGLLNAFSADGILFSAIKYGAGISEPTLHRIAATADVVIVDWKLEGSDPTKCLSLINSVIANDNAQGGRMRLIVVYTGDDENSLILQKLNSDIQLEGRQDSLIEESGSYGLLVGQRTRIVVVNKQVTIGNSGPNPVSPQDLPKKVVEEFAVLSDGLLRSAILYAATTIRDQAHRLLLKFPQRLDSCFVAHLIAIPNHEDAAGFFRQILVDAIDTALIDSQLSEQLSKDKVKEFFDSPELLEFMNSTGDQRNSTISSSINSITPRIFENSAASDQSLSTVPMVPQVVSELLDEGGGFKNEFYEFSSLSIFARREKDFKNNPSFTPKLTFGSILQTTRNGTEEYFICIQPLCDTVRLGNSSNTSFPLLRLKPPISSKGGIVIEKNNDEWINLPIDAKGSMLEIVRFKSGVDGVVKFAKKANGKWIVKSSVPNGTQPAAYSWVGDLRIDKTQNITSALSNRFSQLGIDEFELLRMLKARS